MTKEEVIRQYCSIGGEVAEHVFGFLEAADCFCSDTLEGFSFQYSRRILDYIRDAVHDRIKKEREELLSKGDQDEYSMG